MSKEQNSQQKHLNVEKVAKLAQALKNNLARRKNVLEKDVVKKENNNLIKLSAAADK